MLIDIGRDQLECILKLQPVLDAFINWAKILKISINAAKTKESKVITFERSQSDQVNLAIDPDPIQEFSPINTWVYSYSKILNGRVRLMIWCLRLRRG